VLGSFGEGVADAGLDGGYFVGVDWGLGEGGEPLEVEGARWVRHLGEVCSVKVSADSELLKKSFDCGC